MTSTVVCALWSVVAPGAKKCGGRVSGLMPRPARRLAAAFAACHLVCCLSVSTRGPTMPDMRFLSVAAALERRSEQSRRRLVTDVASVSDAMYIHIPLLSCGNETVVPALASTSPPAGYYDQYGPECCTVTPHDCAQRCLTQYFQFRGTPHNVVACMAVKYAYNDPSVVTSGLPAVPQGGTSWSQCQLLSRVSSCTVALSMTTDQVESAGNYDFWQLPADGIVTFRSAYYFRVLQQPASNDPTARRYAQLQIFGVYGGAQAVDVNKQMRMGDAIRASMSRRCCAAEITFMSVTNLTDLDSAISVMLFVVPGWGTDTSQLQAAYLDLALADEAGAADLMAGLTAIFPNATGVKWIPLNSTESGMQMSSKPILLDAPTPKSGVMVPALAATALASIALGIFLAWMCVSARYSRRIVAMHSKSTASSNTDVRKANTGIADVFLSYRRSDLAIADAVVDQLRLAGLRMFYDRGGLMAGRPFEEELHRAVKNSCAVSVLVTVDFVHSLVGHQPDHVDWLLVELLLAMHYLHTRPRRHIFPLLVGPPLMNAGIVPQRGFLLTDAAFVAYRDALPDIVPTATLALVTRMLARDEGGGSALNPALQRITVRQLMLGHPTRSAESSSRPVACTGLLSILPVSIHGPDDHTGLLLRHRYAERILNALAKG